MVVDEALITANRGKMTSSFETMLSGGWVASLGKSFQPPFDLQPCVASIVHMISILFLAIDIQVQQCC